MKNNNCKKGFTLVELMISIAIISILAGFIITLYPRNVNKFRDARVMSSLSQIRAIAGIEYQSTRHYAGINCSNTSGDSCVCFLADITMLCTDVLANSDESVFFNMNNDFSGFCMVGHMKGDDKYFCIDGGLRAKTFDESPDKTTCKQNCDNLNTCACE